MPVPHENRRVRCTGVALFCFACFGLVLMMFLLPGTQTRVHAYADRKVAGAELFATSGCTHCHGAVAQGTEKGPALRDVRKKLSAEQVHKQIKEGGESMPAFGDALQEEQIVCLIEFLREKNFEKLLARQTPKHP